MNKIMKLQSANKSNIITKYKIICVNFKSKYLNLNIKGECFGQILKFTFK